MRRSRDFPGGVAMLQAWLRRFDGRLEGQHAFDLQFPFEDNAHMSGPGFFVGADGKEGVEIFAAETDRNTTAVPRR